MADNDSGIAFVSGFLLGGVLGAAVGMLLAPKSGAETRAGIAEQGDVWRERAEEMAAQINASIVPTIENVRQQVTPAVDVVRERMGMEPLTPPVVELPDIEGAAPAAADDLVEPVEADLVEVEPVQGDTDEDTSNTRTGDASSAT
jgi:gas vesicle protein